MRGYIMTDETMVLTPYRTASGIEIGKHYRPPKNRDYHLDMIDIYDQDMIQMAYITDGSEFKLEKLVLIGCVVFAFLLVSIFMLLGS
jgi:hypothetical protein